jgi:hypothetical protein
LSDTLLNDRIKCAPAIPLQYQASLQRLGQERPSYRSTPARFACPQKRPRSGLLKRHSETWMGISRNGSRARTYQEDKNRVVGAERNLHRLGASCRPQIAPASARNSSNTGPFSAASSAGMARAAGPPSITRWSTERQTSTPHPARSGRRSVSSTRPEWWRRSPPRANPARRSRSCP